MRVASLNRIEYDHRVYLLPPGQIHYGEEKQIDQKRRQRHDKPVFHEEGNIQSQRREEAEKAKLKIKYRKIYPYGCVTNKSASTAVASMEYIPVTICGKWEGRQTAVRARLTIRGRTTARPPAKEGRREFGQKIPAFRDTST